MGLNSTEMGLENRPSEELVNDRWSIFSLLNANIIYLFQIIICFETFLHHYFFYYLASIFGIWVKFSS